ncbi:MAG: hypothetical protein HUU06_06190 [Planctomycetaceae bacterium]|nr:hypothetical protein [Planctomycetota bacterium]NUN52362.1 hypothetical protein [Planctomycetaceae bacterium]
MALQAPPGTAPCPTCGSPLRVGEDPAPPCPWCESVRRGKGEIPLPPGFRVTRSLGEVTLEWPAGRHLVERLRLQGVTGSPEQRVLFAFVVLLVVGTVLFAVLPAEEFLPWVAAGWALLLLPLLLLLLPFRRRVAVVGHSLLLGWGPFPPLRRTLPAGDIDQIFVVYRAVPSGRTPDQAETELLLEFDLHAVRSDGRRERLLGPLTDREEALFLERWLERRLGIFDRPVDGEMQARRAGVFGDGPPA